MAWDYSLVVHTSEVALLVIAFVLTRCAADAASGMNPFVPQTWKAVAPSELKTPPPKPEARAPNPNELAQTPVAPSRAEFLSPETRAAAKAADPKDPSGAIIFDVPATGAGYKP